MTANQRSVAALLPICAILIGVPFDAAGASEEQTAKQILESTGIQGGLIVHVGCGDGTLTAALRASASYQVHGLDRDASNVAAAREHLKATGDYGEIAVDHWQGDRLPYVDNLVNLVVMGQPRSVPSEEILRVLAPGGVAYVKQDETWQKTVKPRPDSIDEWTHYLHDASGNAVAHDDAVGPPRHLQWIGSPRWSRHHDRMASMSALVSSGGRVFYIMDEGSRISIQLPPKWKVIARDAFNGTVLWKRPMGPWQNHLWPLKSGPTQLARRLVAVDDEVYVTLGLEAPLTALDGATGEIRRTYGDTKSTEEFVVTDTILEEGGSKQRVLFALVNDQPLRLSEYAPQLNVGDQARVGREFHWDGKPRRIVALHAQAGRVLWSKPTTIAPLTLASDQNRVLFHDGQKVVCLDAATGNQLWTSQPAARRETVPFNFGPKLVIYQDIVLFAGGDRLMAGLSLESGKELWSAPHDKSGYQSPEDLLVTGGLVWSAPTTRTQDTGVFTGRDPRTGEVKKQFPPTVDTYWFHHRCYIAKATDRFLLPSRTGIEFVDFGTEQWDINHWVRGGCLYGVMPCNGLVYAPPHDCFCYPEAKLYGLNALAPTSATRLLPERSGDGRWQRGPAFASSAAADATVQPDAEQWPTYRGDATRSGRLRAQLPSKLEKAWETKLGGPLTSIVVADGKVFVAQVDQHTLHALDQQSGEVRWTYTTGGRIDSPPTIDGGRVYFGSADGWVYCLSSSDGELAWRFRAAPSDQRLVAFEQLESVWPVHGNVLVEDGTVYCVAGRSNFLDGGLHFLRLDAKTGRKLSETIIDEKDPATGENLQARLQILNMPAGLPDILSSDGKFIYMRSQQFDREGRRMAIGPHSGQASEQGSVQRGETAHLFSPSGFLDGSWFHRSYWVYGRSFAGGHNGYYQAGKFTPGGRIMVFDDENVYGFGRKSQYYKWTTTLEHQLFASRKNPPETDPALARRGQRGTMIQFENTAKLNPKDKPVTVEMWVKAEKNKNGVLLARGGPTHGFSLYVDQGKPYFAVRKDGTGRTVSGDQQITGRWTHVAGALTDEKLNLYIDGQLVASADSGGLLTDDPAQAMEIGADDGGAVGSYSSPFPFTGLIDEVRLYYGTVSATDVNQRCRQPQRELGEEAGLVLACSFDRGDTKDTSGHNHHGVASGVRPAEEGKLGGGMRLRGFTGAGGSFVKHDWANDVPLLVRAMVLTGGNLFIAGPPDLVDEEESFSRLVNRDKLIEAQLLEQDMALEGAQGGLLQVVSAQDGRKLAEYRLDELPVWDGMAATSAGLFLSTEHGSVLSYR